MTEQVGGSAGLCFDGNFMAGSRVKMTLSQKVLGVVLVVSFLLAGKEVMKGDWLDKARSLLPGTAAIPQHILDKVPRIPGIAQNIDTVTSDSEEAPSGNTGDVQKRARELNDEGVELVLKRKYWRGMLLFKQAVDLDGDYLEPHLNLALTLKKVGLVRSAEKYFRRAESIDANNPILLRNQQNILGDRELSLPAFKGMKNGYPSRLQALATLDSGRVIRLWGIEIHP